MQNEFKIFSIPVKWRKYIYLGTITFLLYVIKLLATMLIDCQNGRIGDGKANRASDSVMIDRLMQEALERSTQTIIMPVVDSVKSKKL